jgi:hypothetical protein
MFTIEIVEESRIFVISNCFNPIQIQLLRKYNKLTQLFYTYQNDTNSICFTKYYLLKIVFVGEKISINLLSS